MALLTFASLQIDSESELEISINIQMMKTALISSGPFAVGPVIGD